MKKIKNNVKGITLIALIVTIIILLILSGVVINTITGDNGLFSKAKEAVNTYKKAEQKESEDLSVLENELEKAKVDWSKVYDSTGYTPNTENTPITTNEGTYYIPAGFKLASDSAGKISDGIVVEDRNGNQWVWVPCYVEGKESEKSATSAVKFDRYAFTRDDWENKQTKLDEVDEDGSNKIIAGDDTTYYFHETMPTEQNESVKTYGGYYIGRYEAGKDAENKAIIKKNQVPYTNITKETCKIKSKEMEETNEYNTNKMFTTLSSSYAWDTTLTWIGKNYAINSAEQGNYAEHKFSENQKIMNTGLTIAVKNIYDMGGNLWEYTTESSTKYSSSSTIRGGCYDNGSLNKAAGYRLSMGGGANSAYSFRITLFLK